MRILMALIAVPLVCLAPRAQEDEALQADHAALSAQLARTEDDLPLPAAEKIRLLRDFVERHTDHPDHPLVLRSRSRLGDLYLLLRDPKSLAEFNAILAHAGPEERDLRGRARYGQAQAAQLRGQLDTARELLGALARDEAGTRYERLSRIALEHLERGLDRDATAPTPGDALPQLGFGRDLDGTLHSTATFGGAPTLLVFWSPDSPASVTLLERLARVWIRSGADSAHLGAMTLGGDPGVIRALAERRGWRFPVIRSEAGFLDPSALMLSVEGVPSSFLIGADSTLLARNLSPGRLAEILPRGH